MIILSIHIRCNTSDSQSASCHKPDTFEWSQSPCCWFLDSPRARAKQEYRSHLITPGGQNKGKAFRVTHPFHPLFGQEFNILFRRCIDGEDYLFFQNVENHNNNISAHWTSLKPPNPYVEISGGRSLFRPRDLSELVQFAKDIKPAKKRRCSKKTRIWV